MFCLKTWPGYNTVMCCIIKGRMSRVLITAVWNMISCLMCSAAFQSRTFVEHKFFIQCQRSETAWNGCLETEGWNQRSFTDAERIHPRLVYYKRLQTNCVFCTTFSFLLLVLCRRTVQWTKNLFWWKGHPVLFNWTFIDEWPAFAQNTSCLFWKLGLHSLGIKPTESIRCYVVYTS